MKKIIITIVILALIFGGGYFLLSEFSPELETFLFEEETEEKEEEEKEEEEEKKAWERQPKEVYIEMIKNLEKAENVEEYLSTLEEYISEGSKKGLEQFEKVVERSSSRNKEMYFISLKENIPSQEEIAEIEEEIEGNHASLKIFSSEDLISEEEKRMILENEEWKLIADEIF